MIDIHSHILPAMDDGAKDLGESLRMAEMAVSEGIRTIIATPHHANGRNWNPAESVVRAVQRFNRELQQRKIPLNVLCGQEIRVYTDLPQDWEQEQHTLLSLHHTRYILLELPPAHIPRYTIDLLHEMTVMGLVPVIAHPERNGEIAANPDKLLDFVERGALTQITSHSVNGLFGKKIQGVSLELCRRRLAHFVASDAHHPLGRSFHLNQAYERISQLVGEETAATLKDNAVKLADNREIEVKEPLSTRKRRFNFWISKK